MGIKGALAKIFRLFFIGLKAIVRASAPLWKQELGKLALATVTELFSADLTNEQKRSEAFTRIKAHAIKIGLEVKDAQINLLIELAVAKLKQQQK